MNKTLKFFLKAVIGILILGIVFYNVGIGNIYHTIIGIKIVFVPLILVLILIQYLLSALTLKILVDIFDNKIPYLKVLEYLMRGYSIGLFSPGRVGELSFVYFLKKDGLDYGKGGVIFLIDKMITFTTISAISVVGILVLLRNFNPTMMLLAAATIPIGIGVFIFFIASRIGRGMIKKYVLKKFAPQLAGFSANMTNVLKKKLHLLLLNFVITLFRWTLSALTIYFMFIGFGGHAEFWKIWLINPVIIVISIVPLSIAGLGLREGSAVVLYRIIDVASNISGGAYLFMTMINYAVGSFVNLYYLFRKSKK